jgi:hypothetical protein
LTESGPSMSVEEFKVIKARMLFGFTSWHEYRKALPCRPCLRDTNLSRLIQSVEEQCHMHRKYTLSCLYQASFSRLCDFTKCRCSQRRQHASYDGVPTPESVRQMMNPPSRTLPLYPSLPCGFMRVCNVCCSDNGNIESKQRSLSAILRRMSTGITHPSIPVFVVVVVTHQRFHCFNSRVWSHSEWIALRNPMADPRCNFGVD